MTVTRAKILNPGKNSNVVIQPKCQHLDDEARLIPLSCDVPI